MNKKFEIKNIQIKNVYSGYLNGSYENLRHEKICRDLSIVQAIKGSYDIALGGVKLQSTGEKGVFVAPSNVLQTIVHHNGKNGVMNAHWVFVDCVVNDNSRFDELFTFPTVLDVKYNDQVYDCIKTIRNSSDFFEKNRAVFALLEILVKESKPKKSPPSIKTSIEEYVHSHYFENIKVKDIAEHLSYSQAQIYKLIKKHFTLTPANYINCVRLQKAEYLLSLGERTITEITFAVGFQDFAYFSRLFKKHYGISPKEYRKSMINK